MRKTLELLALSTCTAALCVTLTGCEAVKGTASGSFAHNDRIVKVTIDGKTYETSWANVVLVEE